MRAQSLWTLEEQQKLCRTGRLHTREFYATLYPLFVILFGVREAADKTRREFFLPFISTRNSWIEAHRSEWENGCAA